jgi:hypothetical protein
LLLIRGILAALRQKIHLSACPILADHLFQDAVKTGDFHRILGGCCTLLQVAGETTITVRLVPKVALAC